MFKLETYRQVADPGSRILDLDPVFGGCLNSKPIGKKRPTTSTQRLVGHAQPKILDTNRQWLLAGLQAGSGPQPYKRRFREKTKKFRVKRTEKKIDTNRNGRTTTDTFGGLSFSHRKIDDMFQIYCKNQYEMHQPQSRELTNNIY